MATSKGLSNLHPAALTRSRRVAKTAQSGQKVRVLHVFSNYPNPLRRQKPRRSGHLSKVCGSESLLLLNDASSPLMLATKASPPRGGSFHLTVKLDSERPRGTNGGER